MLLVDLRFVMMISRLLVLVRLVMRLVMVLAVVLRRCT